jgi:hypothetical protein
MVPPPVTDTGWVADAVRGLVAGGKHSGTCSLKTTSPRPSSTRPARRSPGWRLAKDNPGVNW